MTHFGSKTQHLTGFAELDRKLVDIITIVQLRNLIRVSRNIYLNLKELEIVQDLQRNRYRKERFMSHITLWIARNNKVRLLEWLVNNPSYKTESVYWHLQKWIIPSIESDSFDIFKLIVDSSSKIQVRRYSDRIKIREIIETCVKCGNILYLEYLASIQSYILIEYFASGFYHSVELKRLEIIQFFMTQCQIQKDQIRLMYHGNKRLVRYNSRYLIMWNYFDYITSLSIANRKSDVAKFLLGLRNQNIVDKKKGELWASWTFSTSSRQKTRFQKFYSWICWKFVFYFLYVISNIYLNPGELTLFLRYENKRHDYYKGLKVIILSIVLVLFVIFATCVCIFNCR